MLFALTSIADDRKIVVSGHGELTTVPDRAVVRLGIEVRKINQQDAKGEADSVVRGLQKLCDELSIPKKNIATTQLYVQPEYDWNNKTRERKLNGYLVRRSMEVKLDDLSQLGVLIDRATSLGVNQASPPRLESSKRSELERQALKLAAINAKLNAEAVAQTLDARLGKVHTIKTTRLMFNPPTYPPGPQMMRSGISGKANSGGADTFTVGEITIDAEIAVEFDLEVD